jgi:hypothetical protein
VIIPREIRNCVAFVYYELPDGKRVPAGTAFFVQDPEPAIDPVATCKYCVTARHVVERIIEYGHGGAIWLRLNGQDGQAKWVNVPLTDWLGHPNESAAMWSAHRDSPRIDVSACLWEYPPLHDYDVMAVPTEWLADGDKIAENGISAGDEVFATGLFANHIGKQKNIPIIRCGNIAAMPEEAVETHLGPMDAILIEARSIGGLSGSPVFVSLGAHRLNGKGEYVLGQWYVYLLGLIHGHWDARGSDAVPGGASSNSAINQGIAVVAPAAQILETIRQKTFMDARNATIELIKTHRAGQLP